MPPMSLLPLCLLLACGARSSGPAAPPAPLRPVDPVIEDPAATFAALEARLVAAERVEILARLWSEGAINAHFVGHLRISDRRLVHLDFKGRLDGAGAEALLISDGESMNGKQAPPALNEGLLIGLTRMGILHNVATVAGGDDPYGTDGSVRERVTVGEFRAGPVETIKGTRAASIELTITVSGAKVAEATLFLHPETGLPLLRRQVVHFPRGDMRVVETYGVFRLEAP